MKRPLPPPHEAEILRAIADGMPYAALLNHTVWTDDEVAQTLVRNDLAATPGGTIVRAGAPVPTLLQLAGSSPSQHVRKAAQRADAALVALAAALARDHAGQSAEAARREQRYAVTEWLELLKRLAREAEDELRHLREASPRSRSARRAS